MAAVDSPQAEASAAPAQSSDLVLQAAVVLQDNGESTDDTISAATRLGQALDMSVSITPEWSSLHLWSHIVETNPTNINMNRVGPALELVDQVVAGRLTPSAAAAALHTVSGAPPASTWLFTLAAVTGGVAL